MIQIHAMGVEIERKFLVAGEFPRLESSKMIQGYLSGDSDCTVRVRLEDERAVLAIKGKAVGIRRAEFEYDIPMEEARELLALCGGNVVEKTRYYCPCESHVWEVDVFAGLNEGLVTAEIELSEEDEVFARPDWLGVEVSDDPRYRNSQLSISPYSQWRKKAPL